MQRARCKPGAQPIVGPSAEVVNCGSRRSAV